MKRTASSSPPPPVKGEKQDPSSASAPPPKKKRARGKSEPGAHSPKEAWENKHWRALVKRIFSEMSRPSIYAAPELEAFRVHGSDPINRRIKQLEADLLRRYS